MSGPLIVINGTTQVLELDIPDWGGASFAQALARANLIDEFALITNPVAYGGGKPLFIDLSEALELKLLANTSFASGHVLRLYRPKGGRGG